MAERVGQVGGLERGGVVVDEVEPEQAACSLAQRFAAGDNADPAELRLGQKGFERFQLGIAEAAVHVEQRGGRLGAVGQRVQFLQVRRETELPAPLRQDPAEHGVVMLRKV
ncbi:hypothetical protein D3C81_1837290 [compost metagenome]